MPVPAANPISQAEMLRRWLQITLPSMGTPTALAIQASAELPFPVTRCDVKRQLKKLGLSKHKRSVVPALAIEIERQAHLRWFAIMGIFYDQIVSVDEKKWTCLDVVDKYYQWGYCPVGERLPR